MVNYLGRRKESMSTEAGLVLLTTSVTILIGCNIWLNSKVTNLQILLDTRTSTLKHEIDLLYARKADKRKKRSV